MEWYPIESSLTLPNNKDRILFSCLSDLNHSHYDFPRQSPVLGCLVKQSRSNQPTLTIEVYSPALIDLCVGEQIDSYDDLDITLRANLVSISTICRQQAEELIRHAERMEALLDNESLITETTEESAHTHYPLRQLCVLDVVHAVHKRGHTDSDDIDRGRQTRSKLDLDDLDD